MKTFFTADLHLNHEKIALFTGRPWKTLFEHDTAIISAINEVVDKNDRLFVLGDVSWRSLGSEIERINCKNIHLIWGNHDRHNFGKHFKTAEDVSLVKMGEDKVFLSHYPHAFWPASHRGSYHLYGHVHAQKEEDLDRIWPQRRSMDVGVDNAIRLLGDPRPFSWEEIRSLLSTRTGHDPIPEDKWE